MGNIMGYFRVIVLAITFYTGNAQTNVTVSGVVKDSATGELLIGSTIKVDNGKQNTTSNNYGFYAVTMPKGSYKLSVSFLGYQTLSINFILNTNKQLDIELKSNPINLLEVIVSTKKKNENIAKPLMGVEKLNMAEINLLPVLLGERDILKSIQLLPGIKSAGEGNSGINVRGGGTDQNLILLDEAPVYNASHLLGFFSTFNSDAIKDVSVYKGGMPAQYGGRLSSVLDIKMKDGNNKDYKVSGGVGLIASRINVEGPIVKKKGSFMVSGRRTYVDVFTKLSPDSNTKNNKLYFYDINLKASYVLGKKDRLYLSGYFGRDVLGFGETFSTNWGNATGTLRWNHIVSNKLFSNTSLLFSNFSNEIKIKSGTDNFKILSRIKDINLKQDFDYYLKNNSKLKFGANIIHHTVSPGSIQATSTSNLKSSDIQNRYSIESAIYASHESSIGDKINVVYGLRASNLTAIGPGNYYTYDANGKTLDTTYYKSGKTVASYWNIEPRFSISYQLDELSSLKASYNRNVQNLHLLPNSTTSSPTDLWLPSTNNVKPEIADQVSVGCYKNWGDGRYEFSTEAYYKRMQHQIDYRAGASLRANDNVESELLYGDGRAYGIEFLLKKKTGKLTGWVGYTLSRTEKRFAEINNGNYYPARQDRTHDISVVSMYKLSERWDFSATWVYNTIVLPKNRTGG